MADSSDAKRKFLMNKLLTVSEAADALGLKRSTIRAWVLRRKNLEYVKCGRAVRIPAEAVEGFIRRNTIPVRGERQ